MDGQTQLDIELEKVAPEMIEKMEELPLSLGDWLKLKLSDDKLQGVVDNILEEIDTIEKERKPFAEKTAQYRNMYNQILEETSLPFPGAFNLNVPICAKNVDACLAQTEEAFEDVDPKWSIQTMPDKELISARDIQERTLDYYSDSEMEDTQAWTKVYQDAYLLGTGWLQMTFKRDFEKIRESVEYSDLEQFQNDYPDDYLKYPRFLDDLSKGKTIKLVIEKKQEICRSAKPEHIDWEDVFVPVATNGLEGMLKCRCIGKRVWRRWEEIYMLESQGDYRSGVSEKLKYKLTTDGKPDEIDPDYMKKLYETFDVIYFVDIDNDQIEERCLFTIEKEHKLGLMDIRYPYNHNHPFIIPYYIQETQKGIYQPGLGEKLQFLNIALNAILNHTLNASIIANSLSLKVRSNSDAVRSLYEHQWYPSSILELTNPDDVQQFTFNTPNLSSLISLFAIVERFGEDVSGIVNYILGQESAEDPQAPASKTITLMRKAEIRLRRYIKTLKRSNNEAGYQALRLIYQYVPKSRIAKILGIDETAVSATFKYPLKAITQSSGFAIEKMFEKRDNMNMLGLLMKEPLVVADPKRRVRLYRIIAKEFGSNWDKKIEQVLPSEEEINRVLEAKRLQAEQQKMAVVQRAAQAVLEQGGSADEARAAGIEAVKKLESLSAQQQQQPQSQQQPSPMEQVQ